MKRLVIVLSAFSLIALSGALYSSRMSDYQVAEVFVCAEGVVIAEMKAKTALNRQVLTSVSYCSCEGVDPSFKTEVKKDVCEPPGDMVYSCNCIGRTGY